jgi:transketolase
MAELPDGLIHALEDVATRLRIDSVRATTAAGSGHPTSCASAADVVAAVFFDVMRFDPERPRAIESDRFVLSKGHAAPLLYAAWAQVGVLKRDDLVTLRQVTSGLEGHPTPRLPFVDVATGSLGQGLGIGVGLAIGARLAGSDARTWVLLGDSEMAEGSVWESAAMASYRRLDNLVAIVDVNALGQSGPTMYGHDLAVYQRRLASFGWRTITADGHDMRAVVSALRRASRGRGAPTAIIARTLKGRGLEGVENAEGWHGKALPSAMAEAAISKLEARLHHVPPPRTRARTTRARVPAGEVHPPGDPPSRVAGEVATREAYGDALVRLGSSDPRIVVLDGEVKNSTYAEKFLAAHPERYVEGYIAEQNMVSVAAGLAAQGWIPFVSSFACFLTRAADQVRVAAISRSNITLCGSHAGVSIGEDGPTQMGLEDLAMFRALPEAVVLYPADGVCTDACVQLAAAHQGLVYIRTTRMKTPALYDAGTAFTLGGSKTLRQSGNDAVTIVAAGITLHEALAAHEELHASGIAVRVIDVYCVKPVDETALLAAARATGNRVLTVEDHYAEGGIGDAVAAALGPAGVRVERLAVRDIPRSGAPTLLLERHGIGRAAITARVKQFLGTPAVAA